MDDLPPRTPGTGHSRSDAIAARLATRRRRVRTIRARVAGLSLATLMATSGVVLVQMVTGNDPALARSHPASGAHPVSDAHATAGLRPDPVAQTTTSRPPMRTARRRSASRSTRAAATPTKVTTRAS